MTSAINVLHVEDTDEDAALFRRAILKVVPGSQVLRTDTASEAYALLDDRRVAAGLRVIVLDIKLPGMSGLELLSRIKTRDDLRHIPVVMFSSSKTPADVEQAYAFGAASYVVKPIPFDAFSDAASQICAYWGTVNEVLP